MNKRENYFETFVNQLNERAHEACRCFLWFVIKQFLEVRTSEICNQVHSTIKFVSQIQLFSGLTIEDFIVVKVKLKQDSPTPLNPVTSNKKP